MALCGVVDSIDIVPLSLATSIHGHAQHWALRVCVVPSLVFVVWLLCICRAAILYNDAVDRTTRENLKELVDCELVGRLPVGGIER